MYYCKWSEGDIERLPSICGIDILYAEIDTDGNVRREIGIDKVGKVIHKFPSRLYPYGTYGLFDNQKVVISDNILFLTREEFEELWSG